MKWPFAAHSAMDFDAPGDTAYAHHAENFARVLHIFPREWLGIRAAAGSLPGHKLAIPVSRKPGKRDLHRLQTFASLHGIDRFVFHGLSRYANELVVAMAGAGLSANCFIVYHGNLAQWCHDNERMLATRALDLAAQRKIRSLHFLKRDHSFPVPGLYSPMLLNVPPRGLTREGPGQTDRVFIPGTDDRRKNLHCNAMGAAMNPRISSVLHYAKAISLPAPFDEKLQRIPFEGRHGTFRLMASCCCTLNVSLVECHPMVTLESEAMGTPCLRGPLNLDALESHPYVKAVEVQDPTNPFQIRTRLDHVLGIPGREMENMIDEYHQQLTKLSLERYREFLEI